MTQVHIVGTNTAGQIMHTSRNDNGSWQSFFGDVESKSGERGNFIDTDCALSTGGLHVCGVTSTGKLYHTIRLANGSWQTTFTDVGAALGLSSAHKFKRVSCSIANNLLNVCAIYDTGTGSHEINKCFFAILNANNTWQDFSSVNLWEFSRLVDISCTTLLNNTLMMVGINYEGRILLHSPMGSLIFDTYHLSAPPILQGFNVRQQTFRKVSASYVNYNLHLALVTDLGKIYHHECWQQNFFGNIEGQTGESGTFVDVGCGEKNGQLHIVGTNTSRQILHTIRNSYTSWQQFFGNIESASGEGGDFVSVGVSQ